MGRREKGGGREQDILARSTNPQSSIRTQDRKEEEEEEEQGEEEDQEDEEED